MTTSPTRLEIYSSPKRKRGAPDSIEHSPNVSPMIPPIANTLPEYLFPQDVKEQSGWHNGAGSSSSSVVTGQPQTPDLQGTFIRRIPFSDAVHARKRFAKPGEEPMLQAAGDRTSQEGRCASSPPKLANSVLPSSAYLDLKSYTSSSTIVERPRLHSRSPPLDGNPEDNPMTWHESEITGQNPTDPNDDGYGINGIGFKPTPAIAWARSQKRKQQVADYRNREAREARQRRSDRRRGGSAELFAETTETVREREVKVRFGGLR